MKSSYFSIIAVATIATLLMSASTQAATPSYLICRGSNKGNTRLEIHNERNPATSAFSMRTVVAYYFQPYTGPIVSVSADGSHLLPGQCSFGSASDGPLPPSLSVFFHTITNSNTSLGTFLTPVADANGALQMGPASAMAFSPDRSDPNQRYLPSYITGTSLADMKGTIVDNAAVFRIAVIVTSGRIYFQHLE